MPPLFDSSGEGLPPEVLGLISPMVETAEQFLLDEYFRLIEDGAHHGDLIGVVMEGFKSGTIDCSVLNRRSLVVPPDSKLLADAIDSESPPGMFRVYVLTREAEFLTAMLLPSVSRGEA